MHPVRTPCHPGPTGTGRPEIGRFGVLFDEVHERKTGETLGTSPETTNRVRSREEITLLVEVRLPGPSEKCSDRRVLPRPQPPVVVGLGS